MEFKAKITINTDHSRITFEGSEQFVAEQVMKFQNQTRKSIDHSVDTSEPTSSSPADFVLEKKPKSHHEIVAVLAYLLAVEGKAEFTEEDMRRAYLRARVRPPKVVGQALRDAKSKFDLIDNGEKRGTYKLSHHGDRTVRFDLPRSGA